MAFLTKEIKDPYVIPLAQVLGYIPNPSDGQVEHLAFLQNLLLDRMIDPLYEKVVLTDPAVVAKQAELAALLQQKIDEAKPAAK